MGSCISCRRPDPAKVQRMHQPKIKVFGISYMEWVKMSSGRSIFLRIDSPWPRSSATTATPPLSFPSGQELKKHMKSKHSNWRLASTARKQSRRVCRLCPKLLEQEKECSECKSLIKSFANGQEQSNTMSLNLLIRTLLVIFGAILAALLIYFFPLNIKKSYEYSKSDWYRI